jgi:hypothetical protein
MGVAVAFPRSRVLSHALVLTLVITVLAGVPPVDPARAAPLAQPGAGRVERPLPASAQPNHGFVTSLTATRGGSSARFEIKATDVTRVYSEREVCAKCNPILAQYTRAAVTWSFRSGSWISRKKAGIAVGGG